MNILPLHGVKHPDYLNALIGEIEAVQNTVGCISVAEFDIEQWDALPKQIRQVVARLGFVRRHNDRPVHVKQKNRQTQRAERLGLLHAKAKAIQILAVCEQCDGYPCFDLSEYGERRRREWCDVLLLVVELLQDVRRLRDGE